MKRGVLALFAVSSSIVLMVACGGGGGGNNGDKVELCIEEWDHWQADTLSPPTSENLVDTYTLIGFDIEVWQDGSYLGSIDENDVASFSGSMDIQATTITQDITVEGDFTLISGTYTVTPTSTTSGAFHINDQSGAHDADFSISGNVLTTDSGQLCQKVSPSQEVPDSLGVGGEGSVGSLSGDMILY